MAIFRKHPLKTGNTTRTKASELTLRQSICKLTGIRFNFHVRSCFVNRSSLPCYATLLPMGFLIRSPRHSKQALSKHSSHHESTLIRTSGRILWGIPSRISRSCELASSTLWLQDSLHLGLMPLRSRRFDRVAVYSSSILWWVLRGYLYYR
jgi:hypothetical protein